MDEDLDCVTPNRSLSAVPTSENLQWRADDIRRKSDGRRIRRRTQSRELRSKISFRKTTAINGEIGRWDVKCSLCLKRISVHKKSSVNIICHYRQFQKEIVQALNESDTSNGKVAVLENDIQNVNLVKLFNLFGGPVGRLPLCIE